MKLFVWNHLRLRDAINVKDNSSLREKVKDGLGELAVKFLRLQDELTRALLYVGQHKQSWDICGLKKKKKEKGKGTTNKHSYHCTPQHACTLLGIKHSEQDKERF